MTNRTAARRYARALLDVAVKEGGDLQQIDTQLADFGQLITSTSELRKALLNPAVPAARKRGAVSQICKAAGLGPILTKMLVLLAERDRLVLLPDLLAAYRAAVLDYRKVVRADVSTATPISAARAQAIERSLSQLTGRTVQLSTQVDAALIGGVVARIGSTIYDGSVARQLEKIKARLTGADGHGA
jgi:F-type H+-transporting ATPase subunit delta